MPAKKSKRQQREFWRGATQEDRYEYLVDSPFALKEIQEFHEREETALVGLLQSYVERKEKIAFIEIGSGPGRVIRRIARLVLEKPETWGSCIEYIVGVDFEINMIERSIKNLILKQRKIRDWVMHGTAFEIARARAASMDRENLRLKKVRDAIRERVFFINADARQPFLRCESLVPVVALMFGTLGNIPDMKKVLRNVYEICYPDGEAFIVGFNRENYSIGIQRYNKLAQNHFQPLYETKWLNDHGVFKSPAGFYSRWFFESDFKRMLLRYFQKEIEVKPLDETGFYAIVKPKPAIQRRLKAILTSKSGEPSLQLLCPKCGHPFENGGLPLATTSPIVCSQEKHKFDVRNIMEFRVPILEVD